ncbi:MAG: TadE family protein [Caldilineaceae bacterium]
MLNHLDLHEEEGSQLFEYIAVLPFVMMVGLIVWQFFLVGHTFIVTANAAREGARALAVCNSTPAAAVQAVRAALPNWYLNPQNPNGAPTAPVTISPSPGMSSVTVRLSTPIPAIDIFQNYQELLPRVDWSATMRKERCP